MRKFITILALITSSFPGTAQPYDNSWINYGQQYLKFKVWKEGIHRIDYNTLSAGVIRAGFNLNTIDPRRFQLFRDGAEQPVYIKGEADGIFHASDFIEFLGRPNDGTLDSRLYGGIANQLHDKISMFNDTAFYFLTWTISTANLRFAVTPNDLSSPPPKEVYFMYEAEYFANNTFESGWSYDLGQPLWSSEFDTGEGFIGPIFTKKFPYTFNIPTPAIYSTDPVAFMDVTTYCRAIGPPYPYTMDVKANSNLVFTISGSNVGLTKDFNISFASSFLSSPTTAIDLLPTKGQQSMPYLKITYARRFDFYFVMVEGARKLNKIESKP